MGFGEFLSIEPFWIDLALVQELRGRWDSRSGAFLFPWGHMTLTLEDVTRLTGLRVHGAALSGHSYTDYRHLVESYLGFSPSGEGALRSIDRSEFFSAVGFSGLRRGPEEPIASFCARVAGRLRGTLASSEGPQADLDLRRFLFLLWEKVLFASPADSLSCRLLVFLDDLDVISSYLWGAALLAHLRTGMATAQRGAAGTPGFTPLLQVHFN